MVTSSLPPHLVEEQHALEAEIREAFKDVTREGGVSWSETVVIDKYGSDDERRSARLQDTDTSWIELVDREDWRSFAGIGGFSFLDAIGFRYYLPAAMIRGIRSGTDEGIEFHLKAARRGKKFSEHGLRQLSLLDQRQRTCIARYFRYMVAIAESQERWLEAEHAERALKSYWMDEEA